MAPTAAVRAMASAPQNVTLIAALATDAPPVRAATAPSTPRNSNELPATAHMSNVSGTRITIISGSDGAHRERRGRRQRLPAPGVRSRIVGDAELVARVRGQRVVRHQLVGDLRRQLRGPGRARRRWRHSRLLGTGGGGELLALAGQIRRSVSACELTDTYSPAAIDMAPATSPATPATRISARAAPGGRHADDEAGGRHDAVVGAEDGGAQPADSIGSVSFKMSHGAFLRKSRPACDR